MIPRAYSFLKSLIWRALGILILAGITYVYTHNWVQASWIVILHHLSFIFIYYFHERIWLRAKNKWLLKWKRWIRPFTYEIILGHLVLGSITFIFTGSWLKAGLVTITYIENKLWIYIVYDKIWERFERKWIKDLRRLYRCPIRK